MAQQQEPFVAPTLALSSYTINVENDDDGVPRRYSVQYRLGSDVFVEGSGRTLDDAQRIAIGNAARTIRNASIEFAYASGRVEKLVKRNAGLKSRSDSLKMELAVADDKIQSMQGEIESLLRRETDAETRLALAYEELKVEKAERSKSLEESARLTTKCVALQDELSTARCALSVSAKMLLTTFSCGDDGQWSWKMPEATSTVEVLSPLAASLRDDLVMRLQKESRRTSSTTVHASVSTPLIGTGDYRAI